MYISKLHLQGFKSFLNKTDLTFGEGITTLVGPNGCGKTNIVDAIRWILGEQKTTILRSSKMEDVIFTGSRNRKPLGFCEVTMTIHNNRGILPVEYNDIELTRRVFRSGDSEYYLNKTPCRLKDINNLFVDTGMSSNAYSVIELKMVDSILSHNASDRRHMFEEAAGINHYKQQRHATFRKLEATSADMERVNDIIVEVENTVKQLSLQMKRFERYEKLTRNLKDLDIQIAQAKIQKINSKREPLYRKLKEVQSLQSSVAGQMNLDETLIDKIKEKYEREQKSLSECQTKLSDIEKGISQLNNSVLVWSEQRKGNENRIQHNQDEITQLLQQDKSLITKLAELEKIIDAKKPQIADSELKYAKKKRDFKFCNQQFESLQENLGNLKSQADGINKKIWLEESSMVGIKASLIEKENTKTSLHTKLQRDEESLENIHAEINLQRLEIEGQEKVNIQQLNLVEKFNKKQSKAENEIIKLKEVINSLKSQYQNCESQIQFYREVLESHAGRPSGIGEILSNIEKYPNVSGVISDLIVTDKKYRIAVESAIGEISHYLVVARRKDAIKIIKQTKRSLSIVALDAVPELNGKKKFPVNSLRNKIKCDKKFDSLFDLILGNVSLLPEDEPIEENSNSSLRQVNLNGEFISSGYIFKSLGRKKDSIIGRQQKLTEFEEKLNDIKKQQVIKENELASSITMIEKVHTNLKKETKKLEAGMDAINELDKKLSRFNFMVSQRRDSKKEIATQIKDIEQNAFSLNLRKKAVAYNIAGLKDEIMGFKNKLEELQDEITAVRQKRNDLQQKMQDFRISLMEIEKEEEGIQFRINTAKNLQDDNKSRLAKYKLQSDQMDAEIKQLGIKIEASREKGRKQLKTQEALIQEKTKLELSYNKSYEELQDLQSGVRQRQKLKEDHLRSIQDFELKLAELSQEVEQQIQRINDLYQEKITPDINAVTENGLDELKIKKERIQRSVERIGPVNMAVADDYEKESQRFKFLKEQFNDLEESGKSLQETIEKLDGEAREKFQNTFTKIAENFSHTYTSFFNGGKGSLRLVGDEDPLEADIEIIAQPPGKKTQTLRMLSAGEKALTAIALLFAIYLVKPSPFCILDEVDAPLDDSNIAKFTKVLKDFAKKTQFIVVTHNKLTMEKSDYMYGVTQQEEGVSKIVSVKFANGEMKEVA